MKIVWQSHTINQDSERFAVFVSEEELKLLQNSIQRNESDYPNTEEVNKSLSGMNEIMYSELEKEKRWKSRSNPIPGT